MKSAYMILILFAWPLCLWSQERNVESGQLLENRGDTRFLHMKENIRVTADELVTLHKRTFGLSEKDELKLFRDHVLPVTGNMLQRFQQYYNGIKVHGAVLNIYSHDGLVTKTNGTVIRNLDNSSLPLINEQLALEAALAAFPSAHYKWNDVASEQRLKNKKKNPEATYYPKGELIYMYRKGTTKRLKDDYELCWKFPVNVSRGNSRYVYISAITGDVVNTLPINISCNGTTVMTPMNGSRQIYTSSQGRCDDPALFELFDDCFVDIKVENDDMGAGTDDPICNYTLTNTWGPPSTIPGGVSGDGIQVLWGMRTTYQWYLNSFNWNSYDNAGGSVDCTVFYGFEDDNGNIHGNNAQYNEFEEDFDFGYGSDGLDATDSYTTLDIVGHEFTHGVDDYSADLDYIDESGALDESFADIFGEIVEMATDFGANVNMWLHGEDKGYAGRSFFNPNQYDQPDTYLGDYWCNYNNSALSCTDNDNGGVHTNSGVQNHFFYLLVDGGSGTNDNGTHYSVSGIGWNDATVIAFLAHLYLWGTADYHDARDAWLEAAVDLFGSCSQQAISVGNAWHAVGVGSQSASYNNMITGNVSAFTGNHIDEAINQVFTAGTVNVASVSGSYEVRFYGGNEVVLYPGFTASSGTAFQAKVNPCSITIHTVPRVMDNSETPPPVTQSSVQDFSNDRFSVNPNPFNHSVTVKFRPLKGEKILALRILNTSGMLIDEAPLANHMTDLDATITTENLTDGVYLLQILTDQRSLIRKTIKMNNR